MSLRGLFRGFLPATKTVGVLHSGSSATFDALVQNDLGNPLPLSAAIDARYAADLADALNIPIDQAIDQIADALITAATHSNRTHYVIVAAGGPETAVPLKIKSQNLHLPELQTPAIVFTTVTNPGPDDPVNNPRGLGLVNTFPPLYAGVGGTNLIGMAGQTSERDADRLEILYRILGANMGKNDKIGVLVSEHRPKKNDQVTDLYPRASQLGLTPPVARLRRPPQDASDIGGIDQAFTLFKHDNDIRGVVVMADSLFNDLRGPLVKMANGTVPYGPLRIPAIYQWKAFVEAGGLISFGPKIEVAYKNAGDYAAQILAGKDPENMPVATLPDSAFEIWMNTTTTANLFPNITIPLNVTLGVPPNTRMYKVNRFPLGS